MKSTYANTVVCTNATIDDIRGINLTSENLTVDDFITFTLTANNNWTTSAVGTGSDHIYGVAI